MNTKNGFRLLSALLIFSMAAFVISCSEDESQSSFAESQSVSSEASADSYFEDAEDLSATASLAADASLGGRTAGLDDRFCNNVIVKLMKKFDNNTDTIVINFGDGCTDPRGNVRKGKIIIIFTPGGRFQIDNCVTTMFDNFSVNGIKMEGVRTVCLREKSETPGAAYVVHEITLENGKITWPDNTFAERTAHHFRKWNIKDVLDKKDDEIVILDGGSASGVNRKGKNYTMEITIDVVFKAACGIDHMKYLPVSGEKVLTIEDKSIIMNYGEGDCDNVVTVTINQVTKEVTVDRG